MNRFRRLFLFLVLNVVVSACTTLGVLMLWDQSRGPMPRGVLPGFLERFGNPAPTAASQLPGTPEIQITPTEAYIPYQVQEGDTFESLSGRYGVTAAELRSVNGFSADQELKPGDLLRIPLNPKGTVVIESVIGAGDLETEHIKLKHQGEGELSMVGWRIEDGQGNVFVFPESPRLILFSEGAVNIHSRSGVNTVVDLYWGLDQPVWLSGVSVTLRDPQGGIQATYTVP